MNNPKGIRPLMNLRTEELLNILKRLSPENKRAVLARAKRLLKQQNKKITPIAGS